MTANKKNIHVSVIVPVTERYDDIQALYRDYKTAIERCELTFDFTFVLDGEFSQVQQQLSELQQNGEKIQLIKLAKWFGEATALNTAFENTSGDWILTLPAYYQIEPGDLLKMLSHTNDSDMVICRRWPRIDSLFNRIQTRMFHGLLNLIAGCQFRDLGCGVRLFRRKVLEEIVVYGDQHRFLPMLANQQGFLVREVDAAQSNKERHTRMYQPGVYFRRILDVLTVFFLIKFTRKPLRFFGLIGSGLFTVGGLTLLTVVFQRLMFEQPLSDRPAMLLGSLLMVLGVQVFSLGLIGELIIFIHAKELKEYAIEEIVN